MHQNGPVRLLFQGKTMLRRSAGFCIQVLVVENVAPTVAHDQPSVSIHGFERISYTPASSGHGLKHDRSEGHPQQALALATEWLVGAKISRRQGAHRLCTQLSYISGYDAWRAR
jgi:hypothetical protein